MFDKALAAVDEALGDGPLSRDEFLEMLAARDRFEARFAKRAADFDKSAEWAFDGSVSPVHWMGSFARLSYDDARRLLALGAACSQLPVTAAAVADGTLSVGQVRHIVTHLSEETVALFVEHEAELVPTLAVLPVRHVALAMARWQRHAITTLGLERHDELPDRNLHLSPIGAGRWRLDADLDTEGGALLDTAIRHAITRDAEGEPQRPLARRRADALVDVARWYLDHNTDNKIARRRTHLDVILTIDNLQNGGGGELADGTLIDAKTMARLACDADLHRVIMDQTSTVLDYGRRARIVPNGLRNALNVRDRHCRFSDCDRPPAWCEAHHVFDWEHGGHTRPDNLVLLCSRHHHILHLDGWKHCLHPDNTFEVLTPNGRALLSRPPPLE
jgi:uncharacterized protein DUF222